jgi:hypothetical protein
MDAATSGASTPESGRNSGEISAERTEKDKEEKKRKRKSFMEVVSAMRADSSGATAAGAETPGAGESRTE